MEIAEEIRKIVEGKLSDEAQFVVDVVVSLRGTQKVLVTIDGDQGVTIEDCAAISRELAKTLDETSLLKDSYLLEVGTPGLDQPLKLTRQYTKNIGRRLKVKLKDGAIQEGKLTGVEPEKIVVEQEFGVGKSKEATPLEIQFSDIDKSFVLVSFK
ncbi:MAG: ribosome maturation factor RimP [Chryseolinea sp.]